MCHNSRSFGIQIDGFAQVLLQVVELAKSFIAKVLLKKRQNESHRRTLISAQSTIPTRELPPFRTAILE